MFENPGGKIKKLTTILFWINVVGFVILAFVFGFDRTYRSTYMNALFPVFIIIGPLVSYVECLLLYGFGELIESNELSKKKLDEIVTANEKAAEERRRFEEQRRLDDQRRWDADQRGRHEDAPRSVERQPQVAEQPRVSVENVTNGAVSTFDFSGLDYSSMRKLSDGISYAIGLSSAAQIRRKLKSIDVESAAVDYLLNVPDDKLQPEGLKVLEQLKDYWTENGERLKREDEKRRIEEQELREKRLQQEAQQKKLAEIQAQEDARKAAEEKAENAAKKFICRSCKQRFTGWYSTCPGCGAANTMERVKR